MSQPWKSDLLLRFSRHACSAQLRAPWSRRVVAEVSADGAWALALPAVLKELRREGHDPLPQQASLLVPDELVYLALRPARAAWRAAQQDAVEHFALTLGRKDLVVQVAAMPGGDAWLAAAIEPADLQAWQRLLGEAGLVLAHVQLALLDDLRHLAAQVGDSAIVALMRDEGMTLVRVSRGTPVELSWERCDPQAHAPHRAAAARLPERHAEQRARAADDVVQFRDAARAVAATGARPPLDAVAAWRGHAGLADGHADMMTPTLTSLAAPRGGGQCAWAAGRH